MQARMTRWTRWWAVLVLLTSLAVVDSAGALVRTPSDALDGRSFLVKVTVRTSADPAIPVGASFQNCYTFADDGSFVDPAFPDPEAPVPGVFRSKDGTRVTRYVATAEAGPLELRQRGRVKDRGDDPDRLRARTTVTLDGVVVLRVLSVGSEVPSCG